VRGDEFTFGRGFTAGVVLLELLVVVGPYPQSSYAPVTALALGPSPTLSAFIPGQQLARRGSPNASERDSLIANAMENDRVGGTRHCGRSERYCLSSVPFKSPQSSLHVHPCDGEPHVDLRPSFGALERGGRAFGFGQESEVGS